LQDTPPVIFTHLVALRYGYTDPFAL